MKSITIILFIQIISMSYMLCQTNTNYVTNYYHRYFKVGDMYYSSNLRGLRTYMSELSNSQPDLYEILKPQLRKISLKKNFAIATFVTGCLAGGVSMLIYNDAFAYAFFIATSGYFISAQIRPNENDYFRFINLHNRSNPENRMEWRLGLNINKYKQPEIMLTMRF